MKRHNPVPRRIGLRQQAMLAAIRESVLQRGYPPSIRELGDAVGLCSSSTVHSHLRTLEAKGYLRRQPGQPRSIQLVEAPPSVPLQERVARLEALVREARGWTATGLVASQEQVDWLQRAATLCPEPVAAGVE